LSKACCTLLSPITRRAARPGTKPDKLGPFLPPTLLHAVEAMMADREVCGALDAAGAPVSKYFAELKRAEFFVWHSSVSEWEVDRYLTAF